MPFLYFNPMLKVPEISKHFIKPEILNNSFFYLIIVAQLMVYADDINILVGSVNTVKNGISSS
jgi:hypothetical protein